MLDSLLRAGETRDDLQRAFMENVACGCWYWRGKRDAYGNFRREGIDSGIAGKESA